LPGMIAGILGAGCLLTAVVLAYDKFGARGGNLVLLGVAVGLVGGTLLWMRFFPESRVARLFVSERVVGDINAEQPELLHQRGTAVTMLRPSGMATIKGKRVDVVSEGPVIEPGTPVEVIEVEGMRVVVRAIDPGSPEEQTG